MSRRSSLFPVFLQLVEMEVDVPDGMTVEEALSQQGPLVKVMWESPTGEDIEVPRGMNLATMMEAGLIPPVDEEAATGESFTAVGAGAGAGVGETAPGVFDPAAVKGAEERSAEVSELYAKVIANKAKAKAATGAKAAGSSPTTHNGYKGTAIKDEINGTNSWLSGVLGKGRVGGESRPVEKQSVRADESNTHRSNAATGPGMGVASASASGQGGGEADGEEEMVGYDFILQDRGDTEGKIAKNARALSRCVFLPCGTPPKVPGSFDLFLIRVPKWYFQGSFFFVKASSTHVSLFLQPELFTFHTPYRVLACDFRSTYPKCKNFIRDAAEGEEAWESLEEIANAAMASMAKMDSVEYLPP